MTLTQEDRNHAVSTTNRFDAQDELSATLPNVVRNMLEEFSGRKKIPEF